MGIYHKHHQIWHASLDKTCTCHTRFASVFLWSFLAQRGLHLKSQTLVSQSKFLKPQKAMNCKQKWRVNTCKFDLSSDVYPHNYYICSTCKDHISCFWVSINLQVQGWKCFKLTWIRFFIDKLKGLIQTLKMKRFFMQCTADGVVIFFIVMQNYYHYMTALGRRLE